jgi:hypothetical protein
MNVAHILDFDSDGEETDYFINAKDDEFFDLLGFQPKKKELLPSRKEITKKFCSTDTNLHTKEGAQLFQAEEEQLKQQDSLLSQKQPELETNNEKLDPDEKSIVKGKKPFLMCIFGKPGEGKSALAQYVVYEKFQQKAIDYVMVISNSSFNDDWKFLPPKAIKKIWTPELAKQITDFQKKPGRGHLLVVLEDPVGSFPWEDKQVIQMIITHRHLNISWIINVQYVNKLPPIYRECATYVAIFKQQMDRAKEALFLSYGGDFKDKKEFYELLQKSTGNYYFLFFEAPFQRWSKTKIEPIPKNAQINF